MARKRPSGGALANGTCQISETQAKLARCASLCIKQVANILRPELGAPLPSNFEQYVRSIQNILAPRIGLIIFSLICIEYENFGINCLE